MKYMPFIFGLLIYSTVCDFVFANDLNHNDDRTVVIQEKIFHRYHDLGICFSYIPDDDFYDSYGIGANYVYHLNDTFSWEVIRGIWMFNQEKSLREDIQNSLNIAPSFYDEPAYMVHSQLWFRPLYGKSAVRNKSIVFHETGLFLGAGLLGFDRKKTFSSDANDTALSISFGLGTTFFINNFTCVSIQIRDLMHFKDNQTENRISLEMGCGFRFNFSPRKKNSNEQTIEDFYNYVK